MEVFLIDILGFVVVGIGGGDGGLLLPLNLIFHLRQEEETYIYIYIYVKMWGGSTGRVETSSARSGVS